MTKFYYEKAMDEWCCVLLANNKYLDVPAIGEATKAFNQRFQVEKSDTEIGSHLRYLKSKHKLPCKIAWQGKGRTHAPHSVRTETRQVASGTITIPKVRALFKELQICVEGMIRENLETKQWLRKTAAIRKAVEDFQKA